MRVTTLTPIALIDARLPLLALERLYTLMDSRGASKWRKWVAEMVSVIPVGLPDEGVSDVVDRFISDNHASS